jgi:hypothetical protein
VANPWDGHGPGRRKGPPGLSQRDYVVPGYTEPDERDRKTGFHHLGSKSYWTPIVTSLLARPI